MKTYKGFDKDFRCRGFQYEVGKEYEMSEDDIAVCKKGFHACESPLEVWDHYPIFDSNSAKIGSSGDSAKIGSSGNYAQINSTGEDSVICCAGHECMVKAKQGSWITLSEWEWDETKKRVVPVMVKTIRIDGKRYKEDTWYMLKNKKVVKVQEGEQ